MVVTSNLQTLLTILYVTLVTLVINNYLGSVFEIWNHYDLAIEVGTDVETLTSRIIGIPFLIISILHIDVQNSIF